MQNAEALLGIIRDRGSRGLSLERVYRHLFNRELYLLAYGRIYRNRGAMTPGTTPETVDGMSLAKIDTIIDELRREKHRWTPVRRTYIPKKSGKLRPLGIPTWSDKLLQEVVRLILEAYYEPQFSDHSHGFRPGKGCHTALREIRHNWVGTTWFVEGDIHACFDRLDHKVLLSILAEGIHDGRFLRLIDELLKAGYLEDWKLHATLSGSPQGGVVSPVLSNIYLDRLDKFIETTLLPMYNRGTRRRPNPTYSRIQSKSQTLRRQGRKEEAAGLRRQLRAMPSLDFHDPEYRRLRYLRYADDFALGLSGPRVEAEAIKQRLSEFLRDHLKLELSQSKTLITHARTGAARFLGYEVHVIQNDRFRDKRGVRTANGNIGLRVPVEVVRAKCSAYMRNGKPIHLTALVNNTVYNTVGQYQQEFRGVVEYYRLAYNLHQFNRLKWVMEQSLTKTLAHKLRITVSKVYDRFRTTLSDQYGSHPILQVRLPREGKPPLVARWGGISLRRRIDAILDDNPKPVWSDSRMELVQRLLAKVCELCGAEIQGEVHHVRALKDLQREGQGDRPRWVEVMTRRQRKALVVCSACHDEIHRGRNTQNRAAKA